MRKKCCDKKKCKGGEKPCPKKIGVDKKREGEWLKVYKQGMGSRNVPFKGLGESKPKPKGATRTEYHARTLTGKKFNYAGAGTAFDKRQARGDKGITYSDHCAMLHDYWYNKKDTTRNQIKRADDDFRRCVKASPNYRLGDSLNKRVMTAVFKGKRALEKVGLNPLKGTDSKLKSKPNTDMKRKNGKVKRAVKKVGGTILKEVFRSAVPRKDRAFPNMKYEGRK